MNEMHFFQDTKTPTSSYHHQRAPRTPESYFNVPESIALLNIVKSERIQSAFQSNRKNHASVWEMVADILNRFSARKRTSKQCCNRYENLKKIYTQLKKNPEKHVRRNWPYMILFKEIEEQRGECWGSNGKRLPKDHNELSYYHRRRQAAEMSMLLHNTSAKDLNQHNLLQQLAAHSTDSSNSNNCKMERFLPNQFVEAHLGQSGANGNESVNLFENNLHLQAAVAAVAARKDHEMHLQNGVGNGVGVGVGGGGLGVGNNTSNNIMDAVAAAAAAAAVAAAARVDINGNGGNNTNNNGSIETIDCERTKNGETHSEEFEKDCNGALNLQTNDNNISLKSEPMSEGEFNPDDIQLMQSNYNGSQNFYPHNMDTNILHPDVIVDTDNISDCSSIASIKSKRKLSSSTDGDSTNYELIEYLKRREKRDEELFKRMDAREERLLSLLERHVAAIEALVEQNRKSTNETPSSPAKESDAKTLTDN